MSLTNRAALAIGVAGVLGATSLGVGAQALKEGDLANIKSLKCTFPVATRVVWKDGNPEAITKTTDVLTIEFNQIDAADGSAIIGSVATGNNDVNVQVYGWNMHFLETGRAGKIGVTTVFAQYTTGMRLKAVHSRTDYLPVDPPGSKSEPVVAQYYGDCEATR